MVRLLRRDDYLHPKCRNDNDNNKSVLRVKSVHTVPPTATGTIPGRLPAIQQPRGKRGESNAAATTIGEDVLPRASLLRPKSFGRVSQNGCLPSYLRSLWCCGTGPDAFGQLCGDDPVLRASPKLLQETSRNDARVCWSHGLIPADDYKLVLRPCRRPCGRAPGSLFCPTNGPCHPDGNTDTPARPCLKGPDRKYTRRRIWTPANHQSFVGRQLFEPLVTD